MSSLRSVVSQKKDLSEEVARQVDERILALVGKSKEKFSLICTCVSVEMNVAVLCVKERIWFLLDSGKVELSSDRIYLERPKAA